MLFALIAIHAAAAALFFVVHEPGLWGLLSLLLASTPLYFLPSWIALLRGHHNAAAIFALNALLGWTGLGWVASLVWSFTATREHGTTFTHDLA